MDRLCKAIGCSSLVTLELNGDEEWSLVRLIQNYKTLPMSDTSGDEQVITRIVHDNFSSETDIALIVWNVSDAEIILSLKENIGRMTGAWTEVYRVEKLLRLLVPVLPDYQWETVRNYFFPSMTDHRPADIADAFLILLEVLARKDFSLLQHFTRLFSGSDIPEYGLVTRVADYLKASTVSHYYYMPPQFPAMPVNIIGETGDFYDGMRSSVSLEKSVRQWFSPDGRLARGLPGYEWREEQLALSLEIAGAFTQNAFLLAEAGTGTGKSLAYLIPAYITATTESFSGETIVISTHTKNLQDQLFYKDIPLLLKLADRPFRAVLLKGRANYLCIQRWQSILNEPSYYLSPSERDALLPLIFWESMTMTGDIGEVSALPEGFSRYVWEKINSDRRHCRQQHCRYAEQCHVRKIREAARQAHLSIVNHSLLFSDIHAEFSILGEYHHLIVDEAHQIEKVAQQYLGSEFSVWNVRNWLSHLYERDRFETGLLIQMKKAVSESDLNDSVKKRIREQMDRATEVCVQTWVEVQKWFQEVSFLLSSLPAEDGQSDQYSGRKKVRYRKKDPSWSVLTEMSEDWVVHAGELLNALQALIHTWATPPVSDSRWPADFAMMLDARREEGMELLEAYHTLMRADDQDFVYWYELPQRENSFDTRFYGVPLNIADRLREALFSRLKTCILSSATLSVAGSFDYYRSRIGLTSSDIGPVTAYAAGSSFDFRKQCRVFIPDFLPEPSQRNFPEAIASVILETARQFNRGMLVLFTSYQMMHQCYSLLAEDFRREGIRLLMQGQDSSRTTLTQQFRADISSVLFGTDSFWEGVDVPGEALEILVITKLPFEVPSEPLVAAKMERIEQNGGNAFMDYSLPEAVIKFRQGFGRLIRHKQDRGVVLLLDNRLIRKKYGQWFLKSLPVEAGTVRNSGDLFEEMSRFFNSITESIAE